MRVAFCCRSLAPGPRQLDTAIIADPKKIPIRQNAHRFIDIGAATAMLHYAVQTAVKKATSLSLTDFRFLLDASPARGLRA